MQEKTGLQKSLLLRIATRVLTFRKLPKKQSEVKNLSKFYTSARQISFELFQKVCVEADLSLLAIEGNPGLEELNKAWVDIYMEYADTIDHNYGFMMEEQVDLEVLRSKTMMVQLAVQVLAKRYDNGVIGILKQLGYNFAFDANDKEAFQKDLSRVITRSKHWVLRLREKDNEKKTSKGHKPITYDDFAAGLFALSKHAGYEIKASEISAFDFAVRYRSMVRYFELQKSKNNR